MIYIIVAAILGDGIVTGLLFAFSNFVMQALALMPNQQGMFAMQRINEKIINPIFVALFLGTPVLCLIIAIFAAMNLNAGGGIALMLGALLYLAGPFGITMLFNVPLNNQLADSELSDADQIWVNYQFRWQRWNHIRTYVGMLSMVLLTVGAVMMASD